MDMVCPEQDCGAPEKNLCGGGIRNKGNLEPDCGGHVNRLKALSWR